MFKRSVRALFAVLLLGGVACGIPVIPFNLTPVPRAGDGPSPVKAQVRRVAVTPDLLVVGARPESDSRLVIEIDVHNADPQRAFDLGVPTVRLQDALGGPLTIAGLVKVEWNGLPPTAARGESPATPPPVDQQPPLRLGPGETRTFSVIYDRLTTSGAGGPLRVAVSIPVVGQPPLDLVLAAPVDGGVRWDSPVAPAAIYYGSGATFLSGATSSQLIEPLIFSGRSSHGNFVWGMNLRMGVLYRDSLASGPPTFTESADVSAEWNLGGLPLGFYVDGGLLLGLEDPPPAYRRANGDTSRTLLLPRLSAGIVFHDGARLAAPSLLPTHQPPVSLRRRGIRLGYTHFFNTDDRHGTPGFELRMELAFSP